ncbi:MAG: MaoC family dehydratase [Candidatus Marinimicrobia bacterium]|nr:MaoC family dehydratase [Candidatus Neomarinimicrobiota bacterium]MBL7109673.1 MaoC family dehydratase [Candidatus Neomarinimicrobiota bacterium]
MKQIQIGHKERVTKQISNKDVKTFAELSLDNNPIHLDDSFAKKSIFKKKIVHGLLVSSLISAVIANKLPGPGSIYLSQELKFIKPVFIDDIITAEVEIIEINTHKRLITLSTNCINQNDETVITGKAIVLNTEME